MRVKMKSIYAGPSGNYQPGETADLSTREAKALIAGGYAVDIAPKQERQTPAPSAATAVAPETTQAPAVETATAPAVETAGQ